MKKFLIYAAMAGLAAGIIYIVHKKGNSNNNESNPIDNTPILKPDFQKEDFAQEPNNTAEFDQAKNESSQSVSKRHSMAGEVMKNAYGSIMEDFVKDFTTTADASAVDAEDTSVAQEIDALSDEIDDLLK